MYQRDNSKLRIAREHARAHCTCNVSQSNLMPSTRDWKLSQDNAAEAHARCVRELVARGEVVAGQV
jgi:hypothetical protein